MSVFTPYLALAAGLAAKFRSPANMSDAKDWRIAVLEAERIRLLKLLEERGAELERARQTLAAFKDVIVSIGARRQAEAVIDARLDPLK
jgi:hypothetical protein